MIKQRIQSWKQSLLKQRNSSMFKTSKSVFDIVDHTSAKRDSFLVVSVLNVCVSLSTWWIKPEWDLNETFRNWCKWT